MVVMPVLKSPAAILKVENNCIATERGNEVVNETKEKRFIYIIGEHGTAQKQICRLILF